MKNKKKIITASAFLAIVVLFVIIVINLFLMNKKTGPYEYDKIDNDIYVAEEIND